MLLMARKLKVKSSICIKVMLKNESNTENKPKYTKYIQNSRPDQRGNRLYVERRHLSNREVKRRRLFAERRRPYNRAMSLPSLLKMQETCS